MLEQRRQHLVTAIGAQRARLAQQLGGVTENLERNAKVAGVIALCGALLLARGGTVTRVRGALRLANTTLRWWSITRLMCMGLAACMNLARAEPPPPAAVAPDVLMKALTADVLNVLRTDSAAGKPTNVAGLVEALIVPLFDFSRMTSIAVARNWPLATTAQQEALTAQFKALLVQTYSGALSSYRDHRIEYLPLRAAHGDDEVTVRSTLRRPGMERLAIDYEMERTRAGWKVYDVKIGGVSLIVTYRASFAAQVREGGVDGLIASLSEQNRLLIALLVALQGAPAPK